MSPTGRLHSVTSGSFLEAQIQGPLFGDEIGKRSGMSRPVAVFRCLLCGLVLARLFERSDRRSRSEFCGTTLVRASQWSRRTAPTATA